MSDPRNTPVFLERRSYRRRRMMDAIRLLPIVGGLLWMVPLFWPSLSPTVDAFRMSTAISYVFCVWVIMIGLGFSLWFALRNSIEIGGLTQDEPSGAPEER